MTAAFVLLLGVLGAAPGPAFIHDLEAAKVEAQRHGRPIFVQFTAAWCEPCHVIKDEVFPLPEVRARLQRFVRVAVDVDTEAGQAAWMTYKLPGLPVLGVFTPDGAEVRDHRITGLPESAELVAALDRVIGALDVAAGPWEPSAGAAPGDAAGLSKRWGPLVAGLAALVLGLLVGRAGRRPS